MDDDAGFHRVPLRMGLPFEKKPGIVAHHFRLLAPLAPHPKCEEPSLVAPFK